MSSENTASERMEIENSQDVNDTQPTEVISPAEVHEASGNIGDVISPGTPNTLIEDKDNDSVILESHVETKTIPEINIASSEEDVSATKTIGGGKAKSARRKLLNAEEESKFRCYRERKLRVLIDKCRKKKIVFEQHYIDLSVQFAANPDNLSMAQLEAMRAECMEALDTDDDSSDDNSGPPVSKKARKGLLAPSKPELDPVNPYNQAWQSKVHFNYATQQMGQPPCHVPSVQSSGFRFGSPMPPILSPQQQYGYGVPTQARDFSFSAQQQSIGGSARYGAGYSGQNVGRSSRQCQYPQKSTPTIPTGPPETYVKDGRIHFVKKPPKPDLPANVSSGSLVMPTPPMTPVSDNSAFSSNEYINMPSDLMSQVTNTK